MSHNVLTNVTDLIGDLNRHKEKSIQQKTKKKKKKENGQKLNNQPHTFNCQPIKPIFIQYNV